MNFRIVDIDNPVGQATTTTDSSTGKILLDVNAKFDQTTSTGNAVIIRDPAAPTTQVGTKTEDDGTTTSLNVNIVSGGMVGVGIGYYLRYEELTKDVNLTGSVWQQLYSTTTAGRIHSMSAVFKNNNVRLRLYSDGIYFLNDITLQDVYANYGLDVGNMNQLPTFMYTYNQGKGIIFEFPGALKFDTEFKVEVNTNATPNIMYRGLIVRSEGI